MYISERARIDTRQYYVEEIFERYMKGMLIFYDKPRGIGNQRERITKEVLDALNRGIPFPPVYVSELQTGEFLVLDKSDRLRCLLEFLAKGDVYKNFDLIKDIYYAPILIYVIDYINPRYMHMQIGSFIEEWTALQEQSVRNIVYKRELDWIYKELEYRKSHIKEANLRNQYIFIYFAMFYYVYKKKLKILDNRNVDRFQMLEEVIQKLCMVSQQEIELIKYSIDDVYGDIQNVYKSGKYFTHMKIEKLTKYLCFLWFLRMEKGGYDIQDIFENRILRREIEKCDMSYGDIMKVMGMLIREE